VGLYLSYVRLTNAQLAQAEAEPDWRAAILDLAEASAWDDETEPPLNYSLGKNWDGIRFLLDAAHAPANIINGSTYLSDPNAGGRLETLMHPAEVATASHYLSEHPFETLTQHPDPRAMNEAGIYPQVWDDRSAEESLRPAYEGLRSFFSVAAHDGDAIVVTFG